MIFKNHLTCYNSTGPEGYYIRYNQMDHMDVCEKKEQVCGFKLGENGEVIRGCMSPDEKNAQLCSTDKCNRQLAGIYCFTCQTTDPNCVFSQHEGPFEMCLHPHKGCYTRIYKDNSVERGCALREDEKVTPGDQYIFCNYSGLCNGVTTKYHSCNFLQLNLNFTPKASIPDEYWQKPKQQGWLFESCADVEGFPACYLYSGKKYLEYGCTKDLTDYTLVNYQRGSNLFQIALCDGHYCNHLPELKDPTYAYGETD